MRIAIGGFQHETNTFAPSKATFDDVDDGEGELLARVRSVVGAHMPLVASLDLHANVTRRMVEHADALIAYRTYPHIDMAETGERAAHFLLARLHGLTRPHAALRPLPFLIPLQTQSTMLESSVHFRADFAPIAEKILVCKAPGPMLADPQDFAWKNLAPGIRLKPNGRRFVRA